MIDGEGEYNITVDIDVPEGQMCMARLVYYDRYDNEAGSFAIREKSANFRCPLKTYSYSLQLVNAGVTEFHFHSVIIQEVINEV
jgi:accessory Sec system protein Asp3